MTGSQIYDGVGKLGDELAKLYGFSPGNNDRIANLTAEAKAGLGITSKAKKRTADENLALWQWHVDKKRSTPKDGTHESVEINSQPDNVEIFSQAPGSKSVELFTQNNIQDADIDSQSIINGAVELCSRPDVQPIGTILQDDTPLPVEVISQAKREETVDTISQPVTVGAFTADNAVEMITQYPDTAIVRIAFYTANNGSRTRQVIALDGFYVNALMLAAGIARRDVPKWIQLAVDSWAAFDSGLPITKQVKFLLIRELTAQLTRLRAG